MIDANKFKILAIVPSSFCFGLQHITVDFFANFPETVESHFLLTRWNNGEMEKLLKENKINYSFSWLGMFSRKMDWVNLKMSLHALIKLPRLYFDFIKLKKNFKPDIIYFANHHELILLWPVLLFSKKRVVCHMHDPSPAIPFQKKTFKWYSKQVDKFIAISESVRLRTLTLGCEPGKIETIYNGIYLPESYSNQRLNEFCKLKNWPEDVFITGITGQMTETKGYEDVLEAFKLVYKNNNKVRLALGGKPLEPLYSYLMEKITKENLGDVVCFTGWLAASDIFYRNIDVYVLASRHEEGFGLVVAEAMAYALPVVATQSGGVTEIIENGENGFLVEKQNISQMADQLYILSKDKNLCKTVGKNARNRIEVHFNIKTQSQALVNSFKELF